MEVGSHELCTLDVVSDVNLFVLGVGSVVGGSHRQEQNIFPGHLLEGEGDRNGPT